MLLTHSLSPSKLSSSLFLYAVELEKELHYVSLKLNRVMRKVSALQYWKKVEVRICGTIMAHFSQFIPELSQFLNLSPFRVHFKSTKPATIKLSSGSMIIIKLFLGMGHNIQSMHITICLHNTYTQVQVKTFIMRFIIKF